MNLRSYQVEIIEKSRDLIRSGCRSFLLHLPTGAGKTVVAAEIVRSALSKNKKILFLAHRRELIEQAARKLADLNLPHGIILQNHPSTDLSKPVQVASIQTLIRRDSWDADIIIVDECHLAQAKSYKTILDSSPRAVKIGLTATPSRLDGKPLSDIFQHLLSGPSVSDLMELGHLVPVRHFAPSLPDLSEVRKVRGDYDADSLTQTMCQSAIIGDIVSTWTCLALGRPTVAFCVGIDHAEKVKNAFLSHGIPADIIHGGLSSEVREEVLDRLSSGKIRVLTSVGVLNEGWDMPCVSCAILARPTMSEGLYVQQAGRILRPFPGKTEALILDHANLARTHGLVSEEREWEFAGRIRKPAGKTERRSTWRCEQCFYTNPLKEKVCAECGMEKEKKTRKIVEKTGELRELKSTEKKRIIRSAKTFEELKEVARILGYKPGWAWYQYKSRLIRG